MDEYLATPYAPYATEQEIARHGEELRALFRGLHLRDDASWRDAFHEAFPPWRDPLADAELLDHDEEWVSDTELCEFPF